MKRTGRRIGKHVVEIETVKELSRIELIDQWKVTYGRPPPKGISRRLLEYSVAYAIQVQEFGGLSPSLRRELGKNTVNVAKGDGKQKPKSRERLSQGARFVREWHGQTHVVEVVDGGFQYGGAKFKSLSHIAREITGTRWSGPRFFGL